jgi:hypothetical protein
MHSQHFLIYISLVPVPCHQMLLCAKHKVMLYKNVLLYHKISGILHMYSRRYYLMSLQLVLVLSTFDLRQHISFSGYHITSLSFKLNMPSSLIFWECKFQVKYP